MSNLPNVQLSPRILAAYERLDSAVKSLKSAAEAQKDKVPGEQVEQLSLRIHELEAENTALKSDLAAIDEAGLETQVAELQTRLDDVTGQGQTLRAENASLKDMTSDISARLNKLIGNVEQVLEED